MRNILILATALLLTPLSGHAAELQVTDAWAIATTPDNGPVRNVRPAIDGTTAYMTLANNSIQPVTVTGFATPATHELMAHDTQVTGGVAKMTPVTPLTLDPNKHYVFTPHGAHLMLTGLTNPLAPGQKFPVTISYSDGTTQTVDVLVKR